MNRITAGVAQARKRAALMQEKMLTRNQPKGSRLSVASQVMANAAQANVNQKTADKNRPWISWPSPGMNKLHNAAMTLPVEP
ncbi:MAG TPA: hypothetical protein VN248_08135 [Arenimonas sp.]|nr:hypothetical protein [Arenimonas sp.]